jgi:DMSO reductase anchor subunit
MALTGPLFAALLLRAANVEFNGRFFASLSVLALFASIALVIMQGVELSDIQSSVQRAGALVPNYAALQIWRIALLALASAAGSARFAGTKPRARPVCSSDCCWFWPQNLLAAVCFMLCI